MVSLKRFLKRIVMGHCLNSIFLTCFSAFSLAFFTPASQAADFKHLKPEFNESDDIPELYRNMGVVQRKAFVKSGRFLLDTHFAMDFSDGPYTLYGLEVNPGYAINDYFEIYANIVPLFISNPRSIVGKVEQLKLGNGDQATILFSKPKFQIGGEIVWSPAYGKDSIIGNYIIRSDTFLKFGAALIQYEDGSGLRFFSGIGKSFFLTSWASYRFAVTGSYTQTILDGQKNFSFIAFLELGAVFYF